jgi:hypothetical protein
MRNKAMTFQIGKLVKWKDVCPIRLGYTAKDIGRVVGVYDDIDRESEIDVEFQNGQVVHGADEGWFDPVEEPAASY